MATTMRRQQTDDERTPADDVRAARSATDWRRMTDAAHDHIARRAYELYEERGRGPGHELEDWLKAEHDIEQHHS
jgi:Protein of unknown function (DUF2934)